MSHATISTKTLHERAKALRGNQNVLDARDTDGGMAEWIAAGYETARGA